MTTVRFKTCIIGPALCFQAGQTADIDDDLAAKFISAGYAEEASGFRTVETWDDETWDEIGASPTPGFDLKDIPNGPIERERYQTPQYSPLQFAQPTLGDLL